MADSPSSSGASPILSESPPLEYLNEADLLEFPLLRATNLYNDEENELQPGATDNDDSPGPSMIPARLNEGAAVRRGYFFDRDDYAYSFPGINGTREEDLEKFPRQSTPTANLVQDRDGNEEETILRGELLACDPSSPPRGVDDMDEVENNENAQIIHDDDDQEHPFFEFHQVVRVERFPFPRHNQPPQRNNLPPQLNCTICRELVEHEQITTLRCGCLYCIVCLRRRFKCAIEAEYMFPAACCECDIDPALVRQALSFDILRDYEAKQLEYRTTDRTYCANMECLAFIAKDTIQGNKAICAESLCHTVTCAKCKGKWHAGNCSVDEALQLVLGEAEKQGWKRCARCDILIEYIEGCAHITCQCGHQFCYCCTAVWKTCTCGQAELDRTLGVIPPHPNNENLIEDDEEYHDYNDYLPVHFNYGSQYHARTPRRDMAQLRRQGERRIRPARNDFERASASNSSPSISEDVAQQSTDTFNRDRHFGEHWDPQPRIDEHNNEFTNTSAPATSNTNQRGQFNHCRRAARTVPAAESAQNTPASRTSSGTWGLFGHFAQNHFPDPDRVLPFRHLRDPPVTGSDEDNRSTRSTDTSTVRSSSIFASTPLNTGLTDNIITRRIDVADQRHTGFWSSNGLDVDTTNSTAGALGVNSTDGMHDLRADMQNIAIGVDNNNPTINTQTNNSTNVADSLSIDLNYNSDNEDALYANNPDVSTTAAGPSSDINFENETSMRPLGCRSTTLIAPTHNFAGITADEQAPAQYIEARSMRRLRVTGRLEQAWGLHGYMPNLNGFREYYREDLDGRFHYCG